MSTKTFRKLLVPVAVAVLALAVFGGTRADARETAPPHATVQLASQPEYTDVYECFWATPLSGPGVQPNAYVTLDTDDFGSDLLRVNRLVWMCEAAHKYDILGTPGGPSEEDVSVYACYNTIGGQSVYEPYELDTNNFGDDLALVRSAQWMCESARKYHDGTWYGIPEEQRFSQVWQCFNINAKPNFRPFSISTVNFGYHNILTFTGIQLCENAAKYRQGYDSYGTSEPGVQECFRMERTDPTPMFERVTLETRNFGQVEAIIGRPMMMCEFSYNYKPEGVSSAATPTPTPTPLTNLFGNPLFSLGGNPFASLLP